MFRCAIDDDLELRLLEERHAEELLALVNRNRDHLRRWLPWAEHAATVEDQRDFIRSSLRTFADNGAIAAGIWHQGKLTGGIGLHTIDWRNKSSSIGYWVSADCQGRGLVTRSCRAMLDHAFGELGLNRIEIHVATENKRSRAIPERLSFRQKGIRRQAARVGERYLDMVLYSMLASEWRELRGNMA